MVATPLAEFDRTNQTSIRSMDDVRKERIQKHEMDEWIGELPVVDTNAYHLCHNSWIALF